MNKLPTPPPENRGRAPRQTPNRKRSSFSAERLHTLCAVLNCLVLGVAILLIAAALLVLKRPTVSETEKRKLAEFPEFSLSSLVKGEYTAGILKYYTDTVPGRQTWMDLGATLKESTGFRLDGVKIHGGPQVKPPVDTPPVDTPPVTPPETTPPDSSTDSDLTDPPVTDPPVTDPVVSVPETTPSVTEDWEILDEGHLTANNGILVVNKRAIMLYGGSYTCALQYADQMNAYKEMLGSDVKVWSMTTPTAVSYYLPKKYAAYTNSQKDHISYISENLRDVVEINAYEALLPHVDENIYTRTDHHWTTLGAYYAAQAFADAANVPFADLSTYEEKERTGYVGTMYAYSDYDPVIKNNPETFVYYKPRNRYTTEYNNSLLSDNWQKSSLFFDWVSLEASYCVFLGDDNRVAHIETDCKNGRRLFLIKDSYGNALVPFLTGSFEEIWVVDFRYFQQNPIAFMQEHNVTDFLCSTCAFVACGGSGSRALERMAAIEVYEPVTQN